MALADWLAQYGGPEFKLPEIAGEYADRGLSLVIVGDAACVWDDLEAFGCRVDLRRGSVAKPNFHFMTINKIVETFPGNIEHAYSNEPKLLNAFIAARRNEYRKEFSGPLHTHSCNEGARWRWPWGGWGTSALGACFVGLMLGYDQCVLAGVPLEDGPHNGEPHWRNCSFTKEAADTAEGGMNKHWQNAMKNGFTGRVKSLSGRTRKWLGAPA